MTNILLTHPVGATSRWLNSTFQRAYFSIFSGRHLRFCRVLPVRDHSRSQIAVLGPDGLIFVLPDPTYVSAALRNFLTRQGGISAIEFFFLIIIL